MPSSRGRRRGMGEAESTTPRNLVDINVATVEELSTLVGVGRSRAEAIVETRNVDLTKFKVFMVSLMFLCSP